jgi:predicted Rdx family selenoprotein
LLKDRLDVDAEMIPGSGGIFTVAVDGTVVVEKTKMGFPSENEIVDGVARAAQP